MILVCCHKEDFVFKDYIHVPIHVGASISPLILEYIRDDIGDNISHLNPFFCELTALYWAWKNCKEEMDVWGLEHYRRYFTKNSFFSLLPVRYITKKDNVLIKKETIDVYLSKYDVILPEKEVYPIRLYSDYAMKHERKDLDILERVINEFHPQCISAFNKVIYSSNSLSPYNMFISNRVFFNEYCEWLFSILFEVQKRINIQDYDTYQRRIFGFMSERLLNVYVEYKKCRILYLPVACLGDKPSILEMVGKYVLKHLDNFRFFIIKRRIIK